jgi:hypothetical protein
MIRLAAGGLLLSLLLLGVPSHVLAQAPSLNWGSEVNPSRCPTDQGYRYLEINVTRNVEDDLNPTLDTAREPWAIVDYNQHIQVWKVGTVAGGEKFCALVRYQGSFTTRPGKESPQGGSVIASGIDGSFEGGYLLVFNATERTDRTDSTRGHIGTFTGPGGLFDWRALFFTNFGSGDPQWWGWIYHGGNNGTWVNSKFGNQGGITD